MPHIDTRYLQLLPRTRASLTQRRAPNPLPTYIRAILWATNDHQKSNDVCVYRLILFRCRCPHSSNAQHSRAMPSRTPATRRRV
ncbi:hypothetical protein FB45DRAFT_1059113 [Roridomyces roridus]|uniref:Uncharacterized protein n=1 Tax=Roridomyces roridus TaxID=1738132 RepID=A0AAD7BR91_9AGAR|nr:hypothetical protein FB45DRAFT_1059113 [Roridomyces roridus]